MELTAVRGRSPWPSQATFPTTNCPCRGEAYERPAQASLARNRSRSRSSSLDRSDSHGSANDGGTNARASTQHQQCQARAERANIRGLWGEERRACKQHAHAQNTGHSPALTRKSHNTQQSRLSATNNSQARSSLYVPFSFCGCALWFFSKVFSFNNSLSVWHR